MKFNTWLGSLAFPLTASTSLLPRQANDAIIHFGIIAIRSGSPIHFSSVNANGQEFWIDKETASVCPIADTTFCPPGTDTAFITVPGSDFLGMDTVVPGGQSVYVAPNGALSFTIAHSGYTPPGSSYESFNVTLPEDGSPIGSLTYNETGFLACPTEGTEGPYQVFLDVDDLSDYDVPGGCLEECIGFLAGVFLSESQDQSAAWQYE